ncbi:MAG: LysM peptidoglycan-binding domain-containing protein [Anaerolineae bacterium]|nr:LysM peptidoglycan-binding domain-containing protein [Anaerolineae bacterium]
MARDLNRGFRLIVGFAAVMFAATACFQPADTTGFQPTPVGGDAASPSDTPGLNVAAPPATPTVSDGLSGAMDGAGGQVAPSTPDIAQTAQVITSGMTQTAAAAVVPMPTEMPAAVVMPTETPAVVVVPTEAAAPESCVHVVQRGENLYRIALQYGLTTSQMAAANGITNPDRIYTGQQLTIPNCGAAAPQPPATGTRTHVVQRGENLFRIALRYGVSVDAIAKANGITDTRLIYPGQVLTIP